MLGVKGRLCRAAEHRHNTSVRKMHGVHLLVVVSLFTGVASVGTMLGPLGVASAGAAGGGCVSGLIQGVTAEPDPALDNLFQSYGNSGTGTTWTGGDGTESVALPNGRELWLFGDSSLGNVTNGRRVPAETPFVHNMFITESQGVLTDSLYTSHGSQLSAYVNLRPRQLWKFGFWPGATVVNRGTLQVLGLKVSVAPSGQWTALGNAVATFALPSLRRLGLRGLPVSGPDWSGGALSDGGFTYLYGAANNNTYAARVAGTDLGAPWTYFSGSGWSADPSTAVPIENIEPVGHFSVSKVGSEYVFIAKTSWNTTEITAAFGCSPVGPFGPPQPIYSSPEESQYAARLGIVTYAAVGHPELSKDPKTLVVSYDVNAEGRVAGWFADASIYRPRFIDVTVP